MKNKEYENEVYGVKFSLPEQISVREVLGLRSRVFASDEDSWYIRYWEASIPILEDWECKAIPDPYKVDYKSFSIAVADIVTWVANTVATHMAELDEIPKKS